MAGGASPRQQWKQAGPDLQAGIQHSNLDPGDHDLTPYTGRTIQVYFNSHEDGYSGLTYMYLDDVLITSGGGGPQALQFVAVTPCRLVDTRPQHAGGGPIPGG